MPNIGKIKQTSEKFHACFGPCPSGVGVGSVLRLPKLQCVWDESQQPRAKGSPGGHLGSVDKFFPFFKLRNFFTVFFLKVFLNLKKDYMIIIKQNKIKTAHTVKRTRTKIGFFFPKVL